MLGRLARGLRRHGPVGAARAAHDVIVKAPRERRRRRSAKPTLKELVSGTASIEVTAEALLNRLGANVSAELSDRADWVMAELRERTDARSLQYPERFAVEYESGRFLYLVVRVLQPGLMVETGVANGASTLLILTAMEENGEGALVSFDIARDVGALLTEQERASNRWDLRIITPGEFPTTIVDLGGIDVFLHDSDHSYANVTTELETVWPRVRPGGLVVADDGEMSYAFLEASAREDASAYGLFDRRKLLMAAIR
jgi:predicted O-methyltransferase YrrM